MYQINYSTSAHNFSKKCETAQSACIIAWHYMQAHPEIQQATIIDSVSLEVIRVYMR